MAAKKILMLVGDYVEEVMVPFQAANGGTHRPLQYVRTKLGDRADSHSRL